MKYLGDFEIWCGEILDREINKIINSHQHWIEEPYYILVPLKSSYLGPRKDDSPQNTRIIELKNVGKILHQAITVAQTKNILKEKVLPYGMPQLGTMCMKVDNKKGCWKWIWVLPPDKPILQPVEFDGRESEFVGRSAQGIPLIHDN